MIEAKLTHSGQYKRYDDYFKEWDITTDLPKEEVVKWCFDNLTNREVPESKEWHENIRIGGTKSGDANYYFDGYYQVKEIQGGFHFIFCLPYCD